MPSWRRNISFQRGSAIPAEYSRRLALVREAIRKRGVDGFLITNLVNVRYLSGFRGTSGAIFVTRERNIFVTDFRYREEIEREFSSQPSSQWGVVIDRKSRIETIKRLLGKSGARVVGFEASASYEFFESLSRWKGELRPLRNAVENLRMIKDDGEVALIREAVSRAELAFIDVKPYIRPGRREREMARMLEEKLKKRGCLHIPFDIIVASGGNAAMPHAKATEKRLAPGDLLVVDWGGEAEGYVSDMTRTFLLRGGETSKEKKIYDIVLKANEKALSSVRPGIEGRGIDRAARESIGNAGYGEYFGHGTGHGVGLEVHELPRISWTKSVVVREKMVFTVEPGVYVPGLGGVRIEDMVLVKPGKAEVLTTLPKKLEII